MAPTVTRMPGVLTSLPADRRIAGLGAHPEGSFIDTTAEIRVRRGLMSRLVVPHTTSQCVTPGRSAGTTPPEPG
jgi:hypothetical protein